MGKTSRFLVWLLCGSFILPPNVSADSRSAPPNYDQFSEQDWQRLYEQQTEGLPSELRDVLLQFAHEENQEPIEEKIEDAETLGELAALKSIEIPLEQMDQPQVFQEQHGKDVVQFGTDPQLVPREGEKFFVYVAESFTLLLMKAFGRGFKAYLQKVVNKLKRPDDEVNSYEIVFTPSLDPTSTYTYPGLKRIYVSLGTLLVTENEDELAAVLAHEMTHNNPAQMNELKGRVEVEQVVTQIVTDRNDRLKKNDKHKQREEIRAELGAADRLIAAHYNPWALYKIRARIDKVVGYMESSTTKRLSRGGLLRQILVAMQSHPDAEIFKSAVKSYIFYRSQKENISDVLLQDATKFPNVIQRMRGVGGAWLVATGIQRLISVRRVIGAGILLYPVKTLHFVEYELSRIFGGSDSSVASSHSAAAVADAVASNSCTSNCQVVSQLVHQSTLTDFAISLLATPVPYLAIAVAGVLYVTRREVVELDKENIDKARAVVKAAKKLLDQKQRDPFLLLEVLSKEIRQQNWNIAFKEEEQRGLKSLFRPGLYQYKTIERLLLATLQYIIRDYLPSYFWDRPDYPAERMREAANYFLRRFDRNLMTAFDGETYFFSESATQNMLVELSEAITKNVRPSYDIHTATQIQGFEKAKDEFGFEYRVRLFRIEDDYIAKLSTVEKIRLTVLAYNVNALPLLHRIAVPYQQEMREFVHSGQCKNPKLVESFLSAMTGAMGRASDKAVRRRSYVKRTPLENALRAEQKRANEIDVDRGIVTASFNRPIADFKDGKRNQSEKNIYLPKIYGRFRQYSNLVAISDYFDSLLAKGGILSELQDYLWQYILANLNVIRNESDVERLLAKEYFWKVGNNVTRSKIEESLIEGVNTIRGKAGRTWTYNVEHSETLHRQIVITLKSIGRYPEDYDGLLKLWLSMTERGVTVVTDQMAEVLIKEAKSSQQIEALARHVLNEQRVWEPAFNELMARTYIDGMKYVDLVNSRQGDERIMEIKAILAEIKRMCPRQTVAYQQILEDFSAAILSSDEESQVIEKAKWDRVSDAGEQDVAIRVMSSLVDEVLTWPHEDQFKFIQYFRGKILAFDRINDLFPVMGPERVRRMFEALPTEIRAAQVIDPLLNAKEGLVPEGSTRNGWADRIVDDLIEGQSAKVQETSKQLLNALLYSIEKSVGHPSTRTFILSYILAMPRDQASSPGDILKTVLSMNGATGVKIAQNIVAAGILPAEETKKLREVQDRANPPTRDAEYADLHKIFGTKKIPFRLLNLLGSASMKYAFLYEAENGQNGVGKVLRESALNRLDLEFARLNYMVEYLIKNHGKKYGILRAIVHASQEAVKREIRMDQEALRSLRASRLSYASSDEGIRFKVPRDVLINNRFMVSEYASGVSFYDLPEELQSEVAARILQHEGNLLFTQDEVVHFDPDRHGGNFKVQIIPAGDSYEVLVEPFDFGQYISMTKKERNAALELFTYAQIMVETGPTVQAAQWIADQVGLPPQKVPALKSALKVYFDGSTAKETAYYAVLASLYDVGFNLPIQYFDFMRAILQLKQYEEKVTQKDRAMYVTAHDRLRKYAIDRAAQLRPDITLKFGEKLRYFSFLDWHQRWSFVKQWWNHRSEKPATPVENDCNSELSSLKTPSRPAFLHD